ncbi:MAG: HD domain-containing phosphohydrolase [Porticoccaceae bacterium]|nr:HD domain-containing protein [Porticoccaceae bacterium]
MSQAPHTGNLLIVDHDPARTDTLAAILARHHLHGASAAADALARAGAEPPDLALIDTALPGALELCGQLANLGIPVLLIAPADAVADASRGLAQGARDYLTRPLDPALVLARVDSHLGLNAQVAARTRALASNLHKVIRRLGRAAEYRDNPSGNHVVRMSHFSRLIGRAAGMDEDALDILFTAAPLHDLGKIGIPDDILLKPGKLDGEEWAVMMRHCATGAELIGEHDDPVLRTARTLALCHHEKWDGSGYPRGLKGEQIPLEARIIALCDVFDALISERPYKKGWPVDQALRYIEERAGTHFDPGLMAPFRQVLPEMIAVNDSFADRLGPLPDRDLP